MVAQDRITNKDDFFLRQDRPSGPGRRPGVILQHNRSIIVPVQGHLVAEGNFRQYPADVPQARNTLPVRAGIFPLGLKCIGAASKNLSRFFVGDDRAVHRARPQSTIRVRIQVNQQPLRTATQAQQCCTPDTRIFRGGRRVNLNQPVSEGDDPQCHPRIFNLYINILGNGLHNYS